MPYQRYRPFDDFIAGMTRHWGLWLGLGSDSRAGHDHDDREQEHKFSNHDFSFGIGRNFRFTYQGGATVVSAADFSGCGIVLRFSPCGYSEFVTFYWVSAG